MRLSEWSGFIDNSSAPVNVIDMSEESDAATTKQNKSRRWRPTARQARWAGGLALLAAISVACVVAIRLGHRFGYALLVIVFLLILIRLGYRYEWTGFGAASRPKDVRREIQPRKTLWDWMQLLFVPTMLALLAGGLTWWQTSSERARQAEEAARQEALRAQNTAVQVYLDQMTTLMLEEDLRGSDVDSEVRIIAQARTSAVLRAVEPENQRTLLLFLSDAGLIQQVEENPPTISLDRVDLSDSDLRNIALGGATLSGADLSNANLSDDDLSNANLGEADLSNANLSGANLRWANLSGADLSHAYLSEADLSEADLSYVDLTGAGGVSKEVLEQQAKSLSYATMPDGSIFLSEFEPALSFSLSVGWTLHSSKLPDFVYIEGPETGQSLIFTNPRHVFDPSDPSEPKELPAPENAEEWVSWFQRHPNLDTSKPVSESVGDASGKRIDVTVTSTPENYPKDLCSQQPCVPLYPLSDENGIIGYEGFKDRFIIVDVGGETVLIDASAPTEKFDEFPPKAQKVLDSVEWKGG